MICADRHNNDRSCTVENTVLDNQLKIDEIYKTTNMHKRKKIIRIADLVFFSTDIDSNEIKRAKKEREKS